ncbi:MAG: hypothetical protein Q9191_007907 [Dirinaria sp. TL-2023a]
MAPGPSISRSRSDLNPLSTLPDPRSRSATPNPLSRSNSSLHHPDLSNEVASLSHKLITAINHQTDLDDTLSETRHELDAAHDRVKQLEAQVQQHDALVAHGVLVSRKHIEDNTMELMADLATERKKRAVVEKEKKGIEVELENLTTALFEEANQMVAAARKEREAAEKRNEQLRSQLKDTELLLASHQEQLAELKSVMHSISERDDAESNANGSTAPPTPAMQQQEHLHRVVDALHISTDIPSEEIPPAPPTSFTHLLSPVLRTDLVVYDDFHSLLETPRKSLPSSRVTSGSYGGLSLAGLANAHREQMQHAVSNGSTSSLSTATSYQSSPGTPNTPASTNSSVSSRDIPISAAPLKETRYYKRVLIEDIEPTLRLDAAPGLSWLARRSVINSMSEGTLMIEPMPTTATLHHHACSLCGENRKGNEYRRTHRFRTSENENAQKYPLCEYCLNRMRSTCDFLSFLRMIKDGHWRTDGEQAAATAWEESVRLRERMFWARIGGGVVPTFMRARDSPRSSIEEEAAPRPPEKEASPLEEYLLAEKIQASPIRDEEDPLNVVKRKTSVASISSSYEDGGLGIHATADEENGSPVPEPTQSPAPSIEEASKQLQGELQVSVETQAQSDVPEASPKPHAQTETTNPEKEAEGRTSSSMPGAFEF